MTVSMYVGILLTLGGNFFFMVHVPLLTILAASKYVDC